MSSWVFSKLDIDVLVHGIVRGPIGASDWSSPVENPDELGGRLWQVNWIAAAHDDDAPLPRYTFTPVPCGVTAIEFLKHAGCFRYQTEDEDGTWRRDGLAEILTAAELGVVPYLAEYDEAPWGWSQRDVRVRKGRETPMEHQARRPSAIAEFEREWASLGYPIDLRLLDPDSSSPRDPRKDPAYVLALGSSRPPGNELGFSAVLVALCHEDDDAKHVFASAVRGAIAWYPTKHWNIFRFGNLVIQTGSRGMDDDAADAMNARIRNFGPVDQHWESHAEPVAEINGDVLANCVPWSRDAPSYTRSGLVARTPTQLQRLASLIDDPDVRREVRNISVKEQSVIALRGIATIDELTRLRIYDSPDPHRIAGDYGLVLIADAGYGSEAVASVMIADRLPPGLTQINLNAGTISTRIATEEVQRRKLAP